MIVTLALRLTSAVAVAVMLAVPAAAAVTRPVPSTEATFAALEAHVTASLADNWTLAPTDTAVTGAPEIVSGGGGGSVTETSSPQATSPASPPTAINDRKSFCILSPFWSVKSCMYDIKRICDFLESSAFAGQVPHLLPIRSADKDRGAAFVSKTKDPTTC